MLPVPWTTRLVGLRSIAPPLLVLLAVVLAPTACVLWFTSQAVHTERLAVRQRLADAYAPQLAQCRQQFDACWRELQQTLDASMNRSPPEAFADLVEHHGCTSALIYRDSRLAYPQLDFPLDSSPPPLGWREAREQELAQQWSLAASSYDDLARHGPPPWRPRALLASARCLLRAARYPKALTILGDTLQQPEFAADVDASGRLIAPNALWLAINTLTPADPRRDRLIQRLAERLRRYDGPPMRSPQRLFLMQSLAATAHLSFPTLAAETLALETAQRIESQPALWPLTATGALRRARDRDGLWLFATAHAAALWPDSALRSQIDAAIQPQTLPGTRIVCAAATEFWNADAFLSAPASRFMPEWNLALYLQGKDPFTAAAARQEAVYFWTALTGIAAILLLAAILGLYLRRQIRLTRLKNDLIATVSHELKTPLSSMRVLTDTLLADRVRDPRVQREYLGLIARENVRLSRLIDNFLTFSRMERHKQAFQFQRVAVASLFQAALEAMGERAAVIRTHLPGPLQLEADPDALVTLLVNLLDNAWKYSGDQKCIELSASADADHVRLTVRDNGIGITRRHQRRIFQRFYQVDRQLSRRCGGCGLGLAIVQFIVQGHGGTVEVSSQLDQGSVFTVILPRGDAPAPPVLQGA